MQLTCWLHVSDLWLTCGWNMSETWLTCGWHVADMSLTYGWHVADMQQTCSWHAAYMWLTCSWHSGNMWLTCSWHLGDMQLTCGLCVVMFRPCSHCYCCCYWKVIKGWGFWAIIFSQKFVITTMIKVPMPDREYCNHHPCGWIQYRNGDWNDYDLYHVTTNTL